jgi:hypothetical protein
MSKIPQYDPPKPPKPKKTIIVCTTDGKPLPPEDQKALDDFIEFRIKRAKAKKAGGKEL